MFQPIVHIRPSVNLWVANQLNQYIKWLVQNDKFSGKVEIIVTGASFIYDLSARKREGNFFGPYDMQKIPVVYLATGDIFQEISQRGTEEILCDYLHYLTSFLYTYVNWQQEKEFNTDWENEEAKKIIREYIDYKKYTFESEDRRKKEVRKYWRKKIKARRNFYHQ